MALLYNRWVEIARGMEKFCGEKRREYKKHRHGAVFLSIYHWSDGSIPDHTRAKLHEDIRHPREIVIRILHRHDLRPR